MADSVVSPGNSGPNCFKEAVCIDTARIYDSCSDKDCLEDLQVYFTDQAQAIVDSATAVRSKAVEVMEVFMDVESVPFNRGFYSVEMTFYFLIKLDVFSAPMSVPTQVEGFATFTKRVILYGSEGKVKVFRSNTSPFDAGEMLSGSNLPVASVQVVDPIVLNCRLRDCCFPGDYQISIPPSISDYFGGPFFGVVPVRGVTITLGLFSIVQIERNVQILIPAYDFGVPDKECTTPTSSADDPCELFAKVKFPSDEFFPPTLTELEGCDC